MRLATGFLVPLACFGLLAVACGETASNNDPGGGAGQSMTAGAGGSSAAGTTSSGGSSNAGTTSSAGSSTAGASSTGGTIADGGSASAGASGSSAGGSSAGGSAAGGNGGLVECDPKKVLCRVATPECPQGQVPSVEGNCYGDCVKIERCSCTTADQCPEPEQYTCLKGPMHCSYYLK